MTTTEPSPLANALAKAEPAKRPAVLSAKQQIRNTIQVNRQEIMSALPEGYVGGADRFARSLLTCVALDEKLLACTATSIVGAAIQAAQLGLTPGVLGEAWLIPRKGKCTFNLGWKGYVVLAGRAGFSIEAETVYEGDEFRYTKGLDKTLHHVPAHGPQRGKSVFWYAIARERATGQLIRFVVIDRDHVNKRRDAFEGDKGPGPAWHSWYEEMALGKAVRELCRFLPLSVEMATAIASDGVTREVLDGHADEYPAPFEDEDQVVDGEVVE